MPYPAISSRRMPYDVDGTMIGFRDSGGNTLDYGIKSWLSSAQLTELNNEDLVGISGPQSNMYFYVFFPEKREIEAAVIGVHAACTVEIQGSNDTTNGVDGTWETATFPSGSPYVVVAGSFKWRDSIKPVSFSAAYKTIRLGNNGSGYRNTFFIHLYGRKAAGETPDDLLFVDASTGAEKTSLMDWGDQPEGTTEIDSFKVKNASASKIANDINLQLNHTDFLMSWSTDGPWTATLDIATLGIGALSNTIYIRNKLEPPLLLLGPYAARVIASVGSWT